MRCSQNRCCHNVLWFRFLRRAFIHSGRLSLVWQRCVTIRLMTRQAVEKSSSPGGNVQRACMWSGSNSRDHKRMGQTKRADRFPQDGAHIGIGEKRLAPIGVDGEEIAATRHMGVAIIRHDGIIKPMNGAGTRPTFALSRGFRDGRARLGARRQAHQDRRQGSLGRQRGFRDRALALRFLCISTSL